MDDYNIKVSVIMACYNAGSFIEEAIESVIQQTYKNIELIIVDDGSSDNSLLLAQKMAIKDERIAVYSLLKNTGPSTARNIAIEKAKGEWLANLDADDVFLSSKLEQQMRCIESACSDIVLVGADSYEIDVFGKRLTKQRYPVNDQDLVKALTRRKRFPPHSSLLYRTSVIRALCGFNDKFLRSQDYDLQLRLIGCGKMLSIPEPLVEYRVHDANISKTDGAVEQLTYSMAAGTCYFLRIKGYKDPSQSQSEEEWKEFLNWVAEHLRMIRYDDYRKVKTITRNNYSKSSNKFMGLVHFGCKLMRKKHLGRFVSERLWGSSLYKRLADDWVCQSALLRHPADKNSKHV